MGQVKGKFVVSRSVTETLKDSELQRLDLGNKNVYLPHFDLVDVTHYKNITWLNLPNNFLYEFPVSLCSLHTLKSLRLGGNAISHIPEQISQLTNLKNLDLSKNELYELTDSLFHITSLTDINVHWNCIALISPEISRLQNLKMLSCSLNHLVALPSLQGCIRLETLDLAHNRIVELPESFGHLVSLQSLNLAANRLDGHIHNTSVFQGLTKLLILDLSHNSLASLPLEIAYLVSMTRFKVQKNKLRVLPETICHMTNLVEVDFSFNELTTIPAGFGALTKLQNLYLYENKFEVLHDCLGQLVSLKECLVSLNQLTRIPDSLFSLPLLNNLHFSNNQIKQFLGAPTGLQSNSNSASDGEIIANVSSLQELNCQDNKVETLPQHLSSMLSLRKLVATSNRLSTFPELHDNLTKLQVLELGHNRYREFPESICHVSSLVQLQILANSIHAIPPSIGKLNKLVKLNLSYNQLSSLPSEFTALSLLTELYLSGNLLASIPEVIFQIPTISLLFLNNNSIDYVSPHISSLSNLQALSLNNNLISILPPEIGLCTTLKELDLSHNELMELPNEFAGLVALTDFDCSGNMLICLPPGFEENCVDMHQLKISHNNLVQIPKFAKSIKKIEDSAATGGDALVAKSLLETEDSTTDKHVPFVSCTGNPHIMDWYYISGEKNEKLRALFLKKAKKIEFEICNTTEHADKSRGDDDDVSGQHVNPALHKDKGAAADTTSSPNGTASQVSPMTGNNSPNVLVVPNATSNSPNPGSSVSSSGTNTPTLVTVTVVKVTPKSLGGGSGACPKEEETNTSSTTAVKPEKKKKFRVNLTDALFYRTFVGWSEIRGKRPTQEDTICIDTAFRGNPERVVLGVFDGHGGEKSSELISKKIISTLIKYLDLCETKTQAELNEFNMTELLFPTVPNRSCINNQKREHMHNAEVANVTVSTKEGKNNRKSNRSHSVSQKPQAKFRLTEGEYSWVLNSVFEGLHQKITEKKYTDGAATLLMVVEHDNRRLIVANSGDVRAVIARGDLAIPITTDHKPEDPQEKLRIYHLGGFVSETSRVDGILSLSRAIGDNYLQPHVTFRPDVYIVDIKPSDRFVIIACDGLWDVMTNEQAVAIASSYHTAAEAAAALVDIAFGLGSADNISVIVYRLDQVPIDKLKLSEKSKTCLNTRAMLKKEEFHTNDENISLFRRLGAKSRSLTVDSHSDHRSSILSSQHHMLHHHHHTHSGGGASTSGAEETSKEVKRVEGRKPLYKRDKKDKQDKNPLMFEKVGDTPEKEKPTDKEKEKSLIKFKFSLIESGGQSDKGTLTTPHSGKDSSGHAAMKDSSSTGHIASAKDTGRRGDGARDSPSSPMRSPEQSPERVNALNLDTDRLTKEKTGREITDSRSDLNRESRSPRQRGNDSENKDDRRDDATEKEQQQREQHSKKSVPTEVKVEKTEKSTKSADGAIGRKKASSDGSDKGSSDRDKHKERKEKRKAEKEREKEHRVASQTGSSQSLSVHHSSSTPTTTTELSSGDERSPSDVS